MTPRCWQRAGDEGSLSLDELGTRLRGATWAKPIAAVAARTGNDRAVLIVEFGADGTATRVRHYAR